MAISVKNLTRAVYAVVAPIDHVFQPEEEMTFSYVEWDEAINTREIREDITKGRISVNNLDPIPVGGNGIYGGSGALTANTTITMGSFSINYSSLGAPGLLALDPANNLVGVNTVGPQAHLDVNGSIAKNILTINGNRAVGNANTGDADYTLLVDASAGNVTVLLPPAASNTGRVLVIKAIDTNAGVNQVIVDASGAETIDGALTWITTTQWDAVMIQCDGTAWYII